MFKINDSQSNRTETDPARRTKFCVQTQLATELVDPGCKAGL